MFDLFVFHSLKYAYPFIKSKLYDACLQVFLKRAKLNMRQIHKTSHLCYNDDDKNVSSFSNGFVFQESVNAIFRYITRKSVLSLDAEKVKVHFITNEIYKIKSYTSL